MIEFQNVSIAYKDRPVLRNVSLTIQDASLRYTAIDNKEVDVVDAFARCITFNTGTYYAGG